jgi:molecular chaperone HtpG
LTSLQEYADRARQGQKQIYYASGPSREAIRSNPHLEIFRRKGLEVLYLLEPLDEFVLSSVAKFGDFELRSVEQAALDEVEGLPDVEAKKETPTLGKEEGETFDRLLARIKEILGDRVTDVRASKRLQDSPACLVSPEGVSSQMDKIMRLMAKDETLPRKALEINPDHQLTRNLLRIAGRDMQDPFVTMAAEQLLESAMLLEGYLPDPHGLVQRVNRLLEQSSGWYAEIKGA